MKNLSEKFNGFAPGQVSLAESFNGFANLNESKGNPIYLRGKKGFEPYSTPEMYKSALKVAVKKFEQWLKKAINDKKKFKKEIKKTSSSINRLSHTIEKIHIIDGLRDITVTEQTEFLETGLNIELDCGLYNMMLYSLNNYDDYCIVGPELFVDDLLPILDDVKENYGAIYEYFENMVMGFENKVPDLILTIVDEAPNGDCIEIKFDGAIPSEEYKNIICKSISFGLDDLSDSMRNAIKASGMEYRVTYNERVLHIPLFNFFKEINVKHFKRIFGVNIPKIETNLRIY